MTDLLALDLFAGAGGLSQGLGAAGFRTIYASELEQTYADTFALNHPAALVNAGDIREVDAREVRRSLGVRRGELSLLAGGPPCQGFSINAPERRSDDERNSLFREFLRFADEFRPRALLIENVPGLVNFERGQTLAAIFEALDSLGYRSAVRIVYAPHFGVPQTRFRTIVIGLATGDPDSAFPSQQFDAPMRVNFTSSWRGRKLVAVPDNRSRRRFTTVEAAISDLPPIAAGERSGVMKYASPAKGWYQRAMRAGSRQVSHHEAGRLSAINLERMRHIPPGGNWTDIPHDLLPKGMQMARRSDHTKRYGRTRPDDLACTILTKCDPHWGAYFHYAQDRTFSVREAARIQSFPDVFRFQGSLMAQYEQIGNAVPPLMAQALGTALAGQLGGAARLVS
jgi:DNA (cytosine-5)-methyltransferase 1